MSSSKVRKLKRQIHYTATWLAGVLTVTTESAHFAVTGDKLSVAAGNSVFSLDNVTVTVTSTTEFTVACPESISTQMASGLVIIDFFRTGMTGRFTFTLPRSTGASAVMQSFVTGVGGAVYNFDLSLDGVHWVQAATVTHPTVDGDSDFQTIAPAWLYASIDITSIGADTKLEAIYSA